MFLHLELSQIGQAALASPSDKALVGENQNTPMNKPHGTYEVTVNSNYQWNDVIDPNYKYETDTWKNKVAEIVTFGMADPYNIHIGWKGSSTVIVDSQGNVVSGSGKGWPYS